MFPKTSQRVMMLIAIVVGGLVYLQGADVARAADGSQGCTLLFAASPVTAIGTILLYSIPALVLALVAAAMGNRLAGVFVIAAALLFPAIDGGTIDEWLRNVESARAYGILAGEAVVWGVLVIGLHLLIEAVAPNLVRVVTRGTGVEPAPMTTERLDLHLFSVRHFPVIGGLVLLSVAIRHSVQRATKLSDGQVRILLSGVASTILGLVFSSMMLRNTDPVQIAWGLGIAFVFATTLATIMFPTDQPVGMLLSPITTSIVICGLLALSGQSGTQLLESYYRDGFWHAGLALPVYYASAGVMGATLGVGWSKLLISGFGPIDDDEAGDGESAAESPAKA
ncbi:MAG: hypothetical protein GC159_04245 [Phycisphaera sp.]|nr:hypothetical protein [Phycisphaera sp.]